MSKKQSHLIFNGINGKTGEYFPSLTIKEIAERAGSENQEELDELKAKEDDKRKKYFRPMEGIDPKSLAQTGWGVIFAHNDSKAPEIRQRLADLLKLRQQQAGPLYKEYEYGESDSRDAKRNFLSKNGVGNSNVVEPSKVPYYLLIVGSPEIIPYGFQYQLDVAYAVGRIYFENIEDYEYYAANVVEAETGKILCPRRAVFFGVDVDNDEVTEQSANELISPLSGWIKTQEKDWAVQTYLKEKATKRQLKQLLGGSETPAFLFTASHGVFFDKGHACQLSQQGALICQDWLGPGSPLTRDSYFSADDVGAETQLQGLIAFHFACYSIGTPDIDYFPEEASERLSFAPKPFVARLPQVLLRQGALAVVGHVDRVWNTSFVGEIGQEQLETFKDSLKRLLKGYPVGSAFEAFNERYSVLGADLAEKRDDPLVIYEDLSELLLAYRDARSYAIAGDPAVRLVVGDTQQLEQLSRETEHLLDTSSPALSIGEGTGLISENAGSIADEIDLKPVQNQLIQALEKFVNEVKQAPVHQIEPLQQLVEAATSLLESLKQRI